MRTIRSFHTRARFGGIVGGVAGLCAGVGTTIAQSDDHERWTSDVAVNGILGVGLGSAVGAIGACALPMVIPAYTVHAVISGKWTTWEDIKNDRFGNRATPETFQSTDFSIDTQYDSDI